MTHRFAAAGVIAAGVAGAASAQVLSPPGVDVENTADIAFSVVGQPQTPLAAGPAAFKTDRIVDVVVSGPTGLRLLAPQSTFDTVYSVDNLGNDNQRYLLDWFIDDGMAFTSVTAAYHIDDGDGVFQPDAEDGAAIPIGVGELGTPGAGTGDLTADVPPDGRLWVVLTATLDPVQGGAGQPGQLYLTADSRNPGVSLDPGFDTDTAGDETIASPANDPALVDTILIDHQQGEDDGANEGDSSWERELEIDNTALDATKSMTVVAQDGSASGFDCDADPALPGTHYVLPGACVEYVIRLVSSASALDAEGIVLRDTLSGELTFVDAYLDGGDLVGTVSKPAAGSECDGTDATCEVVLSGGSLPPGEQGALIIRALVR